MNRVWKSARNLNLIALSGTSLALCPHSIRGAEKNTLCLCPNLKDLLIELPRVTLGISLAGYNVLISLAMAALAAYGLLALRKQSA